MSADFDKAIDGAVREMLDVEPPADLRARVMAQLPASGSRLPAAGWLLGSMAAALIVLAVLVAGRSEPVAPRPPVIARGTDVRLPRQTAAAAAEQPAVRIQSRHAAPAPERMVAAAAVDADDITMAPLKSIAPIAVAPITQQSIAPGAIELRPLDPITDVQIAPLAPPDRRH